MNTIYTNNLKTLKNYNYELYKKVINSKNSLYKYVANEDGSINVFRFKNNDFVYNFSDIEFQISEDFKNLKSKNIQLGVVLGIGFGYELNYIVNTIIPTYKTKYLIVIEPEIDKLISIMEILDISSLIKEQKVYFIVGESTQDVRISLNKLFHNSELLYYSRSIDFIYSSPTYSLNSSYYKDVVKVAKDVILLNINQVGNDPNDSLIGLKNMFYNFSEIHNNPGIINLKDKFKDKPALIVSTGPSLNKNIHLIKEIQDKVIIICPDASLKILLSQGVKPDIITSLERTTGTLKFFQDLDEKDIEEVYLAACPVIDPLLYETYKGPRIIIYRDFDHFKWLEHEKGLMNIKSSSGNMAFKIAEFLGCNKIILVGQDLALSDSGNTHAKGMVLGEKSENHYNRGLLKVKGNYTEEVVTSGILYPFLREYELDVAGYNGRCINATEGGAYIYGTELATLQDVIDYELVESFDSKKMIKEYTKNFKHDEKAISINKLKEKTKTSISCLESILFEYKKNQNYMKSIENTIRNWIKNEDININQYNEFHKKLINIKNKMIIENHEYFQLLVAHIIQSYYVHFHINEMWVFGNIEHDIYDELNWLLNYNEFFTRMIGFVEIIKNQLVDFNDYLAEDDFNIYFTF